jgi:hypothetical protein
MNGSYQTTASQAPDQSATGTIVRDRTPAAVTVDNLIRRRLRISDPMSPQEVAQGLRRLFAAEARSLDLEAKGLPLLPPSALMPAAPVPVQAGPSGGELDQALGDVESDLKPLLTDSQLKDIQPELQGWAQAIRGIVADGIAAARVALDPRARDRAMGARRQLGDYARLARFVGALTCGQNLAYRRLAQSLDEVAAMILVLIGEALAGIGFGGGRFLLQAPGSDLQARRDAVILALRNLNGSVQEAYGSQDWPYGLRGLRGVLEILDNSGHSDLRALFDENTIGRLMDDLLDMAATVGSRGLRALGATAPVIVQRLNRLVQIIDNRVTPGSPPLAAFVEAIRLFVDGFQGGASGYRLLFIARPPAVFYGLYGIGGPDAPTRGLIELVIRRGRLAELLDCYMGCNCCEDPAICQVLLDKLLYDTDRAIDLYALGADPNGNGEPEWRAAGYGLLIQAFFSTEGNCLPIEPAARAVGVPVPPPPAKPPCLPILVGSQGLRATLTAIRDQLLSGENLPIALVPPPPLPRPTAQKIQDVKKIMRDELCLEREMDLHWNSLLATMAPSCISSGTALQRIDALLGATIGLLTLPEGTECLEAEIEIPPTTQESLQLFNDIRKLFPKPPR